MFKPLHDKIIVKPLQRFQSAVLDLSTVGGVETSGHVIAVSEEARLQGLNVGDKVHFGTVASDPGNEYLKFEPMEIDGVKHLKMSWQDVCFVEDVDG